MLKNKEIIAIFWETKRKETWTPCIESGLYQLTIDRFEIPFSRLLKADNRWVKLAPQIPWNTILNGYQKAMNNDQTEANGIYPKVMLAALPIKHLCDLTNRKTILQIQENIYMQYLIGYISFSNEALFEPSLVVDLQKRLRVDSKWDVDLIIRPFS